MRVAHRSQGSTVKRRVQHLSDVRWGVLQVDLDLAQLLVPERLRLRDDLLKRGIAHFALRVRTRLVNGDERHPNTEGNIFRPVFEREEGARLVYAADEVPREVQGREAQTSRLEVLAEQLLSGKTDTSLVYEVLTTSCLSRHHIH